jgi:alkyl sulfatase BDS1-like metallo-beta-lactamase superfamily hydrolase
VRQEVTVANPYDVERSWPDLFLEEREYAAEKQGTYKAGPHPVWTIHVPDGWLGNSTVIEGHDGLIVYDTGIAAEAGEFIAAEIAKISDKPIKAIFYSHHHTDHYNGTTSLVAPGDVPIYAWANFEDELANEFGEILPRQVTGILYYCGALLPPEDLHSHSGMGLRLLGGTAGYIPPTHTFTEDTRLEIAGVTLDVFYTGGEAISEFGIHLPDFDMVLIADEFFYGMPNMHSIRGSKPRVPDNYLKAHDRVRSIRPEWLLGSHIIPMRGKDEIEQEVTIYRDATQYLWDQSIRRINKGYTPAELQQDLAELPERFMSPPYSVPTYGTPFTSVPEFFTGWVSWFNGDATDLFPTEPHEQARRLVELMGGRDRVLEAAKEALRGGDPQFAAELARLVVRIDTTDEDARLVKAAALRARGYREVNSIARSWYLTGALELEGAIDPDALLQAGLKTFAGARGPADIFHGWRYQLDAAAAGDTHAVIGFEVTDTGERYAVELRNSVVVVHEGAASSEQAVVQLTTEQLNAAAAPGGTFDGCEIAGDAVAANSLLALLDRDVRGFSMHLR